MESTYLALFVHHSTSAVIKLTSSPFLLPQSNVKRADETHDFCASFPVSFWPLTLTVPAHRPVVDLTIPVSSLLTCHAQSSF